MGKILLVRHAQTAWNEQKRFQGSSDTPLTSRGEWQAQRLGACLAKRELCALFSSDLQRALETASAITAYHDLDLVQDNRLRELDFGGWEGMTYPEIKAEDPEKLRAWEEDWQRVSPPGGESFQTLIERVTSFADRFLKPGNEGQTAIVAHGGSLGCLLCHLLDLELSRYWQFAMAPASLTEISVHQQGAILNVLNDTSHLRDQPQT